METILVKEIIDKFEIIYINNHEPLWQIPVITEKQIFDNFISEKNIPHHYFAFPWANYIDNQWIHKYDILENIINNEIKNNIVINNNVYYFTVVQHICFRDYIQTFKKLRIKYIFTPHKIPYDIFIEKEHDIFIIPISLFPLQTNENLFVKDVPEKTFLTNFIGQVYHKNFVSDIRRKIIENFKDISNCLIQTKDKWHLENIVYKNINDDYNDNFYKNVILNSKFTLCPSGTGPNSIRLWEVLSYGSIPVILSDTIMLPELPNINYNDCFVFWKENDIDKLYDYLLTFTTEKITKMTSLCLSLYSNYFSPTKMHYPIVNGIFLKKEPKIILITQYYIVKTHDMEYNNKRQQELDFCLEKNLENEYLDEIFLFVEEDYDIINKFISKNIGKNNIKKIISPKRLNFKDIFEYYNNNISNDICILTNSDIYLDKSIELVKHINFDKEKIFISLNRYENNDNHKASLLNGIEMDESTYKNCSSIIDPYQESIWSQDGWIWKNKITNINNNFDFNLGVVGCDNYITKLMYETGYKLLNCSKLICINHYDRLSIINTEYGISKGNVSTKRELRIGNPDTYIYLENQNIIPDKYSISSCNIIKKKVSKISELSVQQSISEIMINHSQIVVSSFSNDLCKGSNVLFNKDSYWEPDITDENPYVEFNFENLYEIVVIDITGKPLNRNDYNFGYISKFKISYVNNSSDKWCSDDKIYTGIEINNGNYVKKIYLDSPIICKKIRMYPISYVNIKALKIKFYKYDYQKKNIFDYVSKNKIDSSNIFNIIDNTYFDYKYIDSLNLTNEENSYEYKQNILGQKIEEGVCLFVYVMNRKVNIVNNISSWLNQSINQLIIIDWNSNDDLSEFMNEQKDERILYVNVTNEKYFIRTYAQNLAASLCKFNKICKLDSDIILSPNFFENHPLKNNEFYVGEWNCARNENEKHTHGNIYLFINDYFRINGYNEYIKAYGYDDTDFTLRLLSCGLTKKVFDLDYLYHVPHDNHSRTMNLESKLQDHNNNHMLMVYLHKYYLRNIPFWSHEFKLQKYDFLSSNNNNIICERIKDNEYIFEQELYDKSHEKARQLLVSWKLL